jgi:hypothetical protein
MLKKYFLQIFILFIIGSFVSAQDRQNYAGHFIDRNGKLDVLIKDTGYNFDVDFTKDGAFSKGQAVQEDGLLKGFFLTPDTVHFTILFQEGQLFFSSSTYHIALSRADNLEYQTPKSYDHVSRKKVLEIPYPNGQRVFNSSGDFSFNLPDETWDFIENDGIMTLRKEELKGFFKIISNDIQSIEDARNQFKISDLYPGKFDLVRSEVQYGKRGTFRTYAGFDMDNRRVEFHLLTLVALGGKGVHILSGAHHNDYKPDYEIWCKMVANSFEFTK